MNKNHYRYVLRLGDNALILGQRMTEWCGHSPLLEEDIAMANCALDHVGRARLLLSYAAELEGEGRSEDDLAFVRSDREFENFLLCELPIGDYAFTMARQYLLDTYHYYLFTELVSSSDETLSAIAQKAIKETTYHMDRSRDWVLRLGDGTEESHERMQVALEGMWNYTEELFERDPVDVQMIAEAIGPDPERLHSKWQADINATIKKATLRVPEKKWSLSGGRNGLHTEAMGHLLSEMQHLQRTYPGLSW
ncbi:MAG: phenylacetate-CoA oxygenase subunit PaaC [Proteobacteria bacterium]|jgi:ring-1,2-phenylacetyl-CoA epoxidase subunit PaaC|nr:phenylacetate-CoA oxygenase subunit PaaC [Pseudomonadota bacterium]MBT5065622.1 phenylacetate-CoA oxygenase subunit PaaC [Pseudomonadota bacterium]MBT6192986.1 phenylacetate-CoA oxygenase subunit PaaC [Pseudomonadota bacterium]MBT6464904.1 phenylacetate-CoA oxygenase subunit PaaC [Pseudomonadota bacterium]MBT6674725.1 phenylacetate-CoA oxygenase subunit PaaC [Pseudomonadota bacterium]